MVTGTGPGGVIQADDVLRFQAPAVPSVVITPGAEYTDIELTGMRKVMGILCGKLKMQNEINSFRELES